MQLKLLWIIVLELVIPSCLMEEQCDGPICYAVKVLDATNRYIFKIKCNDALKYIPAKIIRYRCISDINLDDLMDGTGPLYDPTSEDEGSSSDHSLNAPQSVDEGSGLEPISSKAPLEKGGSTSGPTSGAQPTRPFFATTCQKSSLPAVQAGFFNCSGYTVGEKCNLTCDNGYYPSELLEIVCEEKTDFRVDWTDGNFQCTAITCSTNNLPQVQNGHFDCPTNYNISMGGDCNLICNDGFYLGSSNNQVLCETQASDLEGTWSNTNLTCHAITCPKSSLPAVQAGFFSCSGYSVGEKCNLMCDDGYYPSESLEITCEEKNDFRGNWTNGNFRCSANFKKQFVFSCLRLSGCPKPNTIVQLFIATVAERVGAEGVISFPLQNISGISFTLSPGVGEFFNLSPLILPEDSDGTANRRENSSVVVAATDVVAVYGYIRCIDGIMRSTAFRIRGINELGKDYRVVTFQKKGYALLAVVALEDDTHVQLINNANSSKSANITLQMYETYITEGKFDMTGTYIKASSTVFVMTGSRGDQSPINNKGGDPFYECLIPFTNWGSRYYIFPPFKMTSWTAITIMSWGDEDVSVVEWRNGEHVSSSALEPSTIFEAYRELGTIESSKSILVAQFSEPKQLTQEEKSAYALSMLLVPAISQFTPNYIVFPVFNLTLADYAVEHYIIVFLPAGGHSNDLYINKATTTWQVVGNYSDESAIFRINLSPGSYVLENRGSYNATAVVSASQSFRCYTFVLS